MLGRGEHAEVKELRERIRMLEVDCDHYATLAKENAAARDNFKAAHELEHTKRREVEAALDRLQDEREPERMQVFRLAGYVRRLREALIAHTPPMFMREVEALLESTKDV